MSRTPFLIVINLSGGTANIGSVRKHGKADQTIKAVKIYNRLHLVNLRHHITTNDGSLINGHEILYFVSLLINSQIPACVFELCGFLMGGA